MRFGSYKINQRDKYICVYMREEERENNLQKEREIIWTFNL